MRCTVRPEAKGLKVEVPLRRSAIRVPLPGPNSTSCILLGLPSCCQTVRHQIPTICRGRQCHSAANLLFSACRGIQEHSWSFKASRGLITDMQEGAEALRGVHAVQRYASILHVLVDLHRSMALCSNPQSPSQWPIGLAPEVFTVIHTFLHAIHTSGCIASQLR